MNHILLITLSVVLFSTIPFSPFIYAQYNNNNRYNQRYQQNSQMSGGYNQQGYQRNMNSMGAYPQSGGKQQGLISVNPSRSDTATGTGPGPVEVGAEVYVKLNSYNNPSLIMPNSTTCTCPSGKSCPYLEANRTPCNFGFTIVMSNIEGEVKYLSSEFFPSTGYLDLTSQGIETKVNMGSKPTSIDIFVHQFGVVINAETGVLERFQYLYHVDTFVLPTRNISAAPAGGSPNRQIPTLTGQLVGSTLVIEYYTQCLNNRVGPNCDIVCENTPSPNTNQILCYSNITGYAYTCAPGNTFASQTPNCTICPNGIVNGTCRGTVVISDAELGLVSSGFRIATIVLGCLLGLSLIFILFLIILFCIMKNRYAKESNNKKYTSSGYVKVNSSDNTLLGERKKLSGQQNAYNQETDWSSKPAPIKNGVPTLLHSVVPTTPHEPRDTSNFSDDGNRSGHFSVRREAQV
uniref:EGF-like domain-containing protein n=1 Tax=Strongyloides stercoralis TaxID=6248 RepID=A0A0K0EM37_STRER